MASLSAVPTERQHSRVVLPLESRSICEAFSLLLCGMCWTCDLMLMCVPGCRTGDAVCLPVSAPSEEASVDGRQRRHSILCQSLRSSAASVSAFFYCKFFRFLVFDLFLFILSGPELLQCLLLSFRHTQCGSATVKAKLSAIRCTPISLWSR